MVESRAAPGLRGHRIFATRDAEEAQAFVAMRGFRLDVPPPQAIDLDMRLSGVFLPDLFFGRVQYGAAVEIRISQDHDDYRFIAPWRGRVCGNIAKDDVSCGPG